MRKTSRILWALPPEPAENKFAEVSENLSKKQMSSKSLKRVVLLGL